jgi:large subunit ribosomal protein L30
MIIVIRIAGMVEIPDNVTETLFRMRLRRKYCAVLLKEDEKSLAVLKYVRNHVAYGKIDSETLKELILKRGKLINKKKMDLITASKIVEGLDKKGLEELGVKPFFRLAPPVKGIDTKIHFGRRKGVLGDNGKDINELVRRML